MKKDKRELTVFKNEDGYIVIRVTKPGGGFYYGREVDYIILSQEEANKLKDLL